MAASLASSAREGALSPLLELQSRGPSEEPVDERSSQPPGSLSTLSRQEAAPQDLDSPDSDPAAADPESPRDIVHENILALLPVSLFFLLAVFGLVMALAG